MEKVKILAVDDEPFNLDLIELAFMDLMDEVELVMAENGQIALEKLKEHPDTHLILLDLAMPVMNGFDVLAARSADDTLKQIPVIVVTANSEEKNRALGEGANDFLGKPYDVEELKLRSMNYAKIATYQRAISNQNALLEEKVRERTAELQQALSMAKETEYEISARLGKASEYRDLETGMHIKRMSHYSAKLGELSGMQGDEVQLLLYASPLHDIGKVGIPDSILLKPGRFTPEEFDIMKLHAEIGAQMLEDPTGRFPVIELGRVIAHQHHEKYDGTGYPKGLKAEEIHPFARIVAIADVFDALSSKRVYKDAMPLEKVLSIMEEGRGTHFDPAYLDLLLNNLDTFLEIGREFPDGDEPPSIMQLLEKHNQENA
jgi:putative two-component system response regulator